ncbi:MAG: exo-beta-N-acetylmuramidase NamZ family protein [Limisphaerales bacterium]
MLKPILLVALGLMAGVLAAEPKVRLGSEVLAARGFKELRGKRVALITNQTGVNRAGRSTIDLLRAAPGVRLVALMAPEHGLRGTYGAGQEFRDETDPATGLKVFSLYGPGPTRKPTPAMLKGIDAVVYDLQDLGVRSYTYISTLGLAMEACGAAGVEFVVLDRPNPLGGLRVEGPPLNPRFRSFVGQWNVPYAYGLTCGELARMLNGERWITNRPSLTVVPLEGWQRSMVWRDTGLPWVATSPNVQTAGAGLHLVSTGVLGELGGVSIGMGTDSPFQLVGAPWLNAAKFCDVMSGYRLPGVRFTPVRFTPTRGMFKDQSVPGARIVMVSPATAPLVALNYYLLEAVKKTSGRDLFAEAVKRGKNFTMFDKVTGSDVTRKDLQVGRSARRIVESWRDFEESFRQRRARHLLY